MIRLVLLSVVATATLAIFGADAQTMPDMPGMQGMKMPMPARRAPVKSGPKRSAARSKTRQTGDTARPAAGQPAKQPDDAMVGMDMAPSPKAGDVPSSSMPGMDMSGVTPADGAPVPAQTGTALPAGDAPPPPAPADHYADRFFPAADMARSRHAMMREQGASPVGTVLFNLAEYQPRAGRDGYRWDGEGWFGGDINRLTLKSEGEGTVGGAVDSAELQALYSRAIGPYFNLQAGVRHDFAPTPTRTYATIGFEGLAPYMFEVEGAAFVSPQGEILGRLEGYYDQRITQRLIAQPRVELNLSAQDMPARRIGAGLNDTEVGLRLRYEIARRFAPYVGVSYQMKTGRSADYARAAGERPTSTSFVAGVRFGF